MKSSVYLEQERHCRIHSRFIGASKIEVQAGFSLLLSVLLCLVIFLVDFEKCLSHRFKLAFLLNFALRWPTSFAITLIIRMRMLIT